MNNVMLDMLYVNNPSLSQMYHSTSKHPLFSKKEHIIYTYTHTCKVRASNFESV